MSSPFTLSLYDDNKKFNELAQVLIEKVLKDKFRIEQPDTDGNYLTIDNLKFTEPESGTKSYIENKITNGTLVMRVYGDVVEKDKNDYTVNKVLDQVILGTIPYRTPAGTYMIGNDYNVVNQLRNKPGIYASLSSQGESVSAFQFGKGRSFKIIMSPSSHRFSLTAGGISMPVIPLLRIFGFSDSELQQLFGKYWDKNKSNEDWNVFYSKIQDKFFSNNREFLTLTNDEKDKLIFDYFSKNVTLDPENTLLLTGVEAKSINKELLEAVIKKTIKVFRKEVSEDDRDDLIHNNLLTPSHLFADRLDKQLPTLINKAKMKLKYGSSPESVFKNLIKKPLIDTVITSDLSRLDPQYNIMGGILTGKTITVLGEGAIGSVDVVKEQTRKFHTSHTGLIDPTFTPQGLNVGVNLRAAPNLSIDDKGGIKFKLWSVVNKREEVISLARSRNAYILLPGEKLKGKVKVLHNNSVEEVDASKVTHSINNSVFADSLQMVPFVNGMQGPRGIMAATQFPQAVPLINREKAYVIPINPKTGEAADKVLGRDYLKMFGLTSPADGEILSMTEDEVRIKTEGGQERKIEVKKVIPLQYNTGIAINLNTKYKVGDKVKKGDPLFLTNFHDDKGILALGTHLKVLYAPDPRGYGVEDGIVISESAAKKLTSEHFYKFVIELNPDEELSYNKVKTFFQHRYGPEKLENIDHQTSIVKKGSKLKYGDVLACKVSKYVPNETEMILGKVSRSMGANITDSSLIWDHFVQGEVVDIIPSGKSTIIIARTEEPAEVGSKLTARFGNKGVVSNIQSDSDMPRTADGKAVDIIMSAASVPSRVNPNQILEASLGKVSAKTKQRYEVEEFDSDRDTFKFVKSELKKNGITDKETVFDPYTGKTLNMFVGNEYFLKLFSPEKDISARGISGSYDTNKQPVKGGKEGSKGLGLMEFYAMLGHNSPELLKEFGTIKSEKNLNFWRQFEVGLANMPKSTPFTFDKFTAILTSAGARIQRTPQGLSMVPVTDKVTTDLSDGREIKNDMAVKGGSDFRVIKDGLFDIKATGGLEGGLWSEYNLEDGIPHPLLREILMLILEIPKDDVRTYLTTHTGKDIKKALDEIDLIALKERLKDNIKNKKQVSNSTAAFRFINNMETMPGQVKLSDFIITKIPILPPKFRPIVKMQDGTQTISDFNFLYKDMIASNQLLKESKGLGDIQGEAKMNLIDSVDALLGTREPMSRSLQDKGVKGALTYVTGKTSPKEGFFLSKMMKRQQILTGRARIIPDPNAAMDEVGIPEHIAWNSYEPLLRRELRSQGFPADKVTEMLKNKDERARASLNKVLKENYILLNRAPTLHRYSILAGKPKIVPGDYITIPTFFESPLNADYDGDAVTAHVPVTAQGKKEAERMLLSNNPFTGYSNQDLTTSMDAECFYGFYKTSIADPEKLQKWWKETMPEDVTYNTPITKKELIKVLKQVGKKHPDKISDLFLNISRTGIRWAYEAGLTVGMDDIKPNDATDGMINEYRTKINNAKGEMAKAHLADELQKKLQELALGSDSFLAELSKSGSKGKPAQIANILSSSGVMLDPRKREIKIVNANTSQGYDFATFLNMNAKSRMEMIKTKLAVAEPGDLYKQLAFNTRKEVISQLDCGTPRFISIDPDKDDALGRLLAEDTNGLPKNTIITSDNIAKLGVNSKIKVRSPLTCAAKIGVCARCYGADDFGKLPDIGDPIGIKAVNSFSMALSQKALDAKHSGRSLTEDMGKTPFEYAKQLFMGTVKNEAPVSNMTGTVTQVKEMDDKSHVVSIDDKDFFVPFGQTVEVKKGQKVSAGEVLSNGDINTKNIANSIGHGYASKYFSDILHDTILEPAGMNAHKRNIELVAKALYQYVEVKDSIGDFLPGDVITLNEAASLIKKNSKEVSVSEASNDDVLADYYLDYKPLDTISSMMKEDFKHAGIKTIKVFTAKGKLIPVAKGTATLPLITDKDWLDNMGYRYLKKNITNALASGRTQSINPRTNPISAYVTNMWDNEVSNDEDNGIIDLTPK